MKARAYVLVTVTAGNVFTVVEVLRKLATVESADIVTGPYDIIACCEAEHAEDITALVVNHIQAISGVRRTLTCLAIATAQMED